MQPIHPQEAQSVSIKWPYKNTGVGCHALLQGIFPDRGVSLHPTLPRNSNGRLDFPGPTEEEA